MEGYYDFYSALPTATNWTRQTNYTSLNKPRILLTYYLKENIIHSSPVLGYDETIYFGGAEGTFFAFNNDGSLKWKKSLGGCCETPIIAKDRTIYVGLWDGNFYALNEDGEIKWKYLTGGEVNFSPAISRDGTVYFVSSDHNVYAIDNNGQKLWSYSAGNEFWSSPAIAKDGTIYFGTYGDENLNAISPAGTFKWSCPIGFSFNSSLLIGADGTIYVEADGIDNKSLFAVDSQGYRRWALPNVTTSPAFSKLGTLLIGANFFRMFNVDLKGEIIWETHVKGFMYYPPLECADGVIYVASTADDGDNGKTLSWIQAFSPAGQHKWTVTIPGRINSPAVGVNKIYVVSDDPENGGTLIILGD